MPLTLLSLQDHIATITLNADAKRNIFSDAMLTEVLAHFDECEITKARVVIIRANAAAPVWTAGHDLSLVQPGADPTDPDSLLILFLKRIRYFPAPVIAMVNASVWGGGCELIMACDLAIAAEHATIAMTASKMGLPYDPGLLGRWLRHCSIHKIKEMFFTAQPISAADAYAAGIYNHVVPADELEAFTLQIAATIAANSPEGNANIKYQLNALSKAPQLDADTFAELQAARTRLLHSDTFRERLRALKEKLRIE